MQEECDKCEEDESEYCGGISTVSVYENNYQPSKIYLNYKNKSTIINQSNTLNCYPHYPLLFNPLFNKNAYIFFILWKSNSSLIGIYVMIYIIQLLII